MAYTTIDDPELYFQVKLYAGNAGAGTSNTQAITLDGSEDMSPDMVYIKARDGVNNGEIFDTVRGVYKYISTNSAGQENTAFTDNLTAFNSDGFTLGVNTGDDINDTGKNYVAWCWVKSATVGLDIVTYTGNATARTISHSLSAVPSVMWVKNLSPGDVDWRVYHHKNTAAPETDYLILNTTAATADDATAFNDVAPTSSVFSVGTSDQSNGNTDSMMAFLFAEKQGFSKFGSFIGNGNADGPMVYTGFSPAYVVVKNAGGDEAWNVWNNKTPGYNVANKNLQPNSTVAEQTSSAGVKEIDFLSNGFKIRGSNTELNQSGNTHIYMAFAEAPLVNSNGVPCTAR